MSIANFETKLRAANTVYSSAFDALRGDYPGTYQLFSEDMQGIDGVSLNIGYTENLGVTRVLKAGESRQYDGLVARSTTYDLETIYRAHQLERKAVKYDPSGRVGKSVSQFASEQIEMVDRYIWAALKSNTVLGPDGVALISASHPTGEGTQSNTTATALGHSSYRAGKAAMRGFTRENGDALSMVPTHLFVPVTSEDVAKEVTGADKPVAVDNSGAESGTRIGVTTIKNVYQGDSTAIVTPLMAAGTWLLMDLSGSARPWAHGFGEKPTHNAPDAGSEALRNTDMLEYFLQGDICQGPANWQTIYGKIS